MANLYFMKVWAVGGSGKPEVILNEGELCENRSKAWEILLERIYRYPFPHQYVICSVKRDVLIGLELPVFRDESPVLQGGEDVNNVVTVLDLRG